MHSFDTTDADAFKDKQQREPVSPEMNQAEMNALAATILAIVQRQVATTPSGKQIEALVGEGLMGNLVRNIVGNVTQVMAARIEDERGAA